MKSYFYRILNQSIYFKNVSNASKILKNFEDRERNVSELILECDDQKCLSDITYRKEYPDAYGIRYLSLDPSKKFFFSKNDPRHFIHTDHYEYSKLNFCFRGDCSDDVFMELFMAGFYSYISLKQSLLMHASAVSYQGSGIVFTAASGIGKTTQAELWNKYRDAEILNGDKVFLKQEMDGIHAWGSPWSGSSAYAENKSAVLKAMIVLEQAKENSIRKLSGLEILEQVFPHIFLPLWDVRCENAVLDFMDHVLKTTDIYLLRCRPDEDAVSLTENVIFKK